MDGVLTCLIQNTVILALSMIVDVLQVPALENIFMYTLSARTLSRWSASSFPCMVVASCGTEAVS